ncbi:MAG TPA: agmatinase [Bacteroidales bacterium]|nr:agmatinase [Bacteroidales bacterium]
MAITNFGGDEVLYGYDESKIIIVPVPYDATSTYIRGADKGPAAILEASLALEFYDIETGSEAHRLGIHTIAPLESGDDPEKITEAVYQAVSRILSEHRFPVVIGGNHTVSIGAFRAVAEAFTDITILQLDAHSDLRPVYEGSPLNHACAAARAREHAPLVQVGIRSMSVEELPFVDRKRIFYAHELYSDKSLYDRALDLLSGNVYITVDLDVFDPSVMPSTGTPEPGGPDYRELMFFLREVFLKRNVVGFDVVELCPSEFNKAPDFMAAKVIYQMLSYKFGL